MSSSTEYDVDFHAWALDQARRLRDADVPGLDTENIAEEIESLGRNDRRELARGMGVLLTHLLKWQHQPERRGESWIATIGEQRRSIGMVLDESPSLRPACCINPLPLAGEGRVRVAAQRRNWLLLLASCG